MSQFKGMEGYWRWRDSGKVFDILEPLREETEKRFKDMGFNRVYPPQTLPGVAITDLKHDLGITDLAKEEEHGAKEHEVDR